MKSGDSIQVPPPIDLERVIARGVSAGLWRFFWSVVGVVMMISIVGLLVIGIILNA